MEQIDIFSMMYPKFKIRNKVRLIELFAGIGAQAMALRDLGVDFERYRVVEFDKYAIGSYNAVHGTHFPVTDIRDIKGADLGIVDKDEYTYIVTYSFPCTDLSCAGKQAGMKKGGGTRSGLLWEVERLLDETEELPQVLLMENVPQVIGWKNISDFRDWQTFLINKGYTNFTQIINAKDYGVAQNRERCFMLSILGDYSYTFPKPMELKWCMRDYLEDNVPRKYYVENENSRRLLEDLEKSGRLEEFEKEESSRTEPDVAAYVSPDCQRWEIVASVASRGRNTENPTDGAGSPTAQRLEINPDGVSNALTTAQKDNMVLEKETGGWKS